MNEEEITKVKGIVTDAANEIKGKQTELETAVKGKASQSAVDGLFAELKGKMDAFELKSEAAQKQLDEMATKAARLQEKGNAQGVTLKDEIQKVLTKEALHDIVNLKQSRVFSVKAAVNMLAANTVGGGRIPLWDREPGVAKQPDRSPFILDLVASGTLMSDTISWVERSDRQGFPASQSLEGDAYPKLSTAYTEFNQPAQFTTAQTKVSNKNIEDIDFLVDEINTEIVNGLELTLDTQLLSGSGTAPQHKGILSYAPAFALPSGFLTKATPNKYDVLAAALLLIQIQRYYPTAILMHPTDAANMALIQDTQTRYQMPYFVKQNDMGVVMFMGIPIIENLGVALGTFVVGDFTKAKFFLRRGITVNIWDQNEDDAVRGFKTITGTARGAFRIKNVEATAFVKGTFSTAVTALTTV